MAELIPLRWPPEWKDPALLKLLDATPVNCLVGEEAPPFALGEIPFFRSSGDEPPPDVTIASGVWPDVRSSKDTTYSADAGPTGAPWVDSNGWVASLARTAHPGQTVWLNYLPPGGGDVIRPEDHILSIAEAETYGAHWIITFHESLRLGLETGNAGALGGWKRMTDTLRFFEAHRQWKNWETVAALAVISDFEGDNELLSTEFLNLAARRHLSYRIIEKGNAADADLTSLEAILYIDTAAPQGELRQKLLAFVRAGGLLMAPASISSSPPAETRYEYQIFPLGRGEIAVPEEEWYDPYTLAEKVHQLVSRRKDVVRIWNGGSMNCRYTASPDGESAVVQLVNYSRRRGLNEVTLGLRDRFASARWVTPGESAGIKPAEARFGIELPLPPFSVYAGIELSGRG